MLKFRGVRVAVDLQSSDRGTGHIELSAIHAVHNDRSPFAALGRGRNEGVDERLEIINFGRKTVKKGLVDFHRLGVAFRRQPIFTGVRPNGQFLFHGL